VKHSLSLTDDVGHRLKETAYLISGATPSLLADFAIKRLLDSPIQEISEMLTRYKFERRGLTRDWWRTSFWALLAGAMKTTDSIGNPRVPRDYEDYYLVLLPSNVGHEDDENDPFEVHMGPRAGTDGSTRAWQYLRTTSPAQAALEVATSLKGLGVAMDYEGRIKKVRTMLAERLGADPNDADRFGNGEFIFGMHYGMEGQRGAMLWRITRLDSPGRPHTQLTFQWRLNTARQMAESLISAYEKTALA
jgi:hypothetical protein